MAATKAQGRAFTLFMGGLTAAAPESHSSHPAAARWLWFLALAVVAFSLFRFLKIKPLEGKVALGAQPAIHEIDWRSSLAAGLAG